MRRFTFVLLVLLLVGIGVAALLQSDFVKDRRLPKVPEPVKVVTIDPLP